ncbi:hypothetical protein CRUP_032135 [Coryphaenoides rupestris]|nr:hypothetical protein CRUP_032135 [Coryphaenoides rupestris]
MSEGGDIADHVTCTVKAAVNLQIGDTKTESARSGVSVVDVNLPFGKTADIEHISFKNYYCAFVSVRVLKRTPGREAQWSTALRDLPLMENPHTEPGSQDYFSVHRDQLVAPQLELTSQLWSPVNGARSPGGNI